MCSCFSCVQLFATPWTVARQAPLSMGFSRQEFWSGLPFPSPGDLPDEGIEPASPALQADSLPILYLWGTGEAPHSGTFNLNPQKLFVLYGWENTFFHFSLLWIHQLRTGLPSGTSFSPFLIITLGYFLCLISALCSLSKICSLCLHTYSKFSISID